jgi:hypothetical protein
LHCDPRGHHEPPDGHSWLAIVLAVVWGAYASWPRQADLRGFEPVEIARLERAMWRDYYEKRYVALFGHLYELSRTQFGLRAPRQLPNRAVRGTGAQGVPADALPARRPTPRCRRS